MPLVHGPLDWDSIQLAVFDVDGTLYDQRGLRLAMLALLAKHAVKTRSVDVPRVLHLFRRCRESLADQMTADFLVRQYIDTANRCGRSADDVKAIVEEWMELRPLPLLHKHRYAGIDRLFRDLSKRKIVIATLSDYPVDRKLSALGLSADILVSAADSDVGLLKPNPAGLRKVLAQAGVSPEQAIMVGDRVDRDWAAAQQLGIRTLIRSRRRMANIDTFESYNDPIFRI